MEKKVKLGVIGGGFMAQAIIKGAVEKKFLAGEQILVSEPDISRRAFFKDLGVNLAANNREVAES